MISSRRGTGSSSASAPSGASSYPTAANFVLLRCRAVPAKEVFRRLLEDYGILVRDVLGAAELAGMLAHLDRNA